ncbi:helix-turn-helix transcriptional regulator [Streptomyces sp. WMMC500]|uniref:telomere-associated protein Tap n=1 Tax=Streptomyces sp. WMMC500 TaxID=3015154 RepID=UPI00248B980B|nr:helix-turn-helix transcriptional regulator [Streptomyces sp. WMMC500]WBB60992.1 helix-turn-helix transcriptional regulator [Streptomyces sp. WMMC500]
MVAEDRASQLFEAVDALVARSPVLPLPAERRRLREAHGLTQQDVADALQVRRATVGNWESDDPKRSTEPRPPERDAYARLLDRLAELYPPPAADIEAERAPVDLAALALPDLIPPREPPPTWARPRSTTTTPPTAGSAASARPTSTSSSTSGSASRRRPAMRQRGTAPAAAAVGEGNRFPAGALAVLDGDGAAHLTDGRALSCPAGSVVELVDWALAAGLGAERLHRFGQDADPLVALTAAAAERFGLPSRLENRSFDDGMRLAEEHPVVREIQAAGWKLTRRGFGPWPRIYRPAEGGRRRCVQLAILPWEALEERAWPGTDQMPPGELARMLGTYAARVLTPRGSTAVTGLELMTALRPPTRPVRAGDGWTSGPVTGSLTTAVDPAPPEAPPEHPIAQGRGEGQALDEEAYDWVRPGGVTDAEARLPYVIGLDVNMAFAAAANRLTVGLSAPLHTDGPRFDKKIPGAWYVDLSHIELDPRLPSPFTPTGERPTGPAWYATPTVAYAAELGHHVAPLEAWLRPESGAYLDPWYERLRDAYLATMADLGVTKDLSEAAYVDAMADHKDVDPAATAALSAIKATVKGGIGKLRERAQGKAKFKADQRWPALQRPTWRPDIRAAVIATARINMHRKMLKMTSHGLYPIAVLSDCVVYPSPGPSPLDVLPRTPEGKPAPGTFRLGVSPGMAKLEGVRELWWAAELLEQSFNPARHIKDDPTRDEQE